MLGRGSWLEGFSLPARLGVAGEWPALGLWQRVLGLRERPHGWLLAFLAGWLLEGIHYTVSLLAYDAVPYPVSPLGLYARVVLGGVLQAGVRLLALMGLYWVSAWLLGDRLGGRDALWAASVASLLTGIVSLAATPLAGRLTAYDYSYLCFTLHMASWAAAPLASLPWSSERGLRRLGWAVLATVLAGFTPVVLIYPESTVYSLIVYPPPRGG